MAALRRAWQQVRRSGESPGSDGVKPDAFEAHLDTELNRLRQQILNGTYQPQPVRRFYIRKPSGKQRPITLWAIRDRVAQRVIHDYLTPTLELIFLECSFGFRPGRAVEDAIQAIVTARDQGLGWVVDADIRDCFGSIPLDILLGQVNRVVGSRLTLRLIESWLFTPVINERGAIAGLSQGGVISPQLANLYLHRFDEMILAALPRERLIRFADDFVILCADEGAAGWSLEVARRSLENLKLAFNPRKTRLTTFDEGFDFLGVRFIGRWYQLPNTTEGDEPR
jgi:group II intron reverse transcriptase/maturase